MDNKVIFIMGVSGSGKTVVGQLLAQKLDVPFLDGDDFHPDLNIKKMSTGIPLTDADRKPWLNIIHSEIVKHLRAGWIIVACSALRQQYRAILEDAIKDQAIWIFLRGSEELIRSRLVARANHFMPTSLLHTQLETLEEPGNAVILDISFTPQKLVDEIMGKIGFFYGS